MNNLRTYTSDWKFSDYILTVLILLIPVYNRLMPVFIIILGINLFFARDSWDNFKGRISINSPGFWFIIFFLIHLVGMTYSSNQEAGWSDVGMKFSFIALPIILSWSRIRLNINNILDIFLLGLVLSCIIAFSFATFRSVMNIEDNHWAYFTESYLAYNMHRSYYAAYLAFGVLISLRRAFINQKYLVVGMLFLITLFLTYSKAGILIFLVLIIPVLFIGFKQKVNRVFASAVAIGLPLLMIGMIAFIPTLNVRFKKMIEGVQEHSSAKNSLESNQTRLIMWETSIEVIKGAPLIGYGTGDVNDELRIYNYDHGNTAVADKSFNSHNQFLNTWVQLGLFGLIPLVFIFVTALGSSIRYKLPEFTLLLLVIIMSMLFESYLEIQAGIIPVTLLIVLFALKSDSIETSDSNTILST